jgi:hypothetical protein
MKRIAENYYFKCYYFSHSVIKCSKEEDIISCNSHEINTSSVVKYPYVIADVTNVIIQISELVN